MLVVLLLLTLPRMPVAQDAATAPPAPAPDPAGSAPAAGPAAGDATAAPPTSAPDAAVAPAAADATAPAASPDAGTAAAQGADGAKAEADLEAETRAAIALSRGRRSGEVVRLAVEGHEVLALWRRGEASEARGGVVLLHSVPGSLDEPAVTGALRRTLPASGFSTLSLALPLPADGSAPLGSAAWQEAVRQRLAAAFAWMVENDGPVVALIGHGTSAAHVKRWVDAATGRPEGLQAVVLIDAGPGLDPAESTWLRKLPVPVLDLVPGRAGEEAQRLATQRRASARRLGGAEYRSVAVAGVGDDWYPQRQRLIAAVRGFLLRHTAPPASQGR